MGGRGAYSYSGQQKARPRAAELSAYAVASLNGGVAKGTTTEAAIGRFREQMMDERFEYSAYVDDAGYVHALASTGREGETGVAPLAAVAKETGVSTVIHNHPSGGSDGRIWGGPFSEADLSYIASAHAATGGKVNRMVATSREGTYSAKVTRPVTQGQVRDAAARAERSLSGRKFQSEISMWRAVNDAYTSEFAKIGVNITFTKQPKRSGRLVTKKTGTY